MGYFVIELAKGERSAAKLGWYHDGAFPHGSNSRSKQAEILAQDGN